jgi:hypothetical protein
MNIFHKNTSSVVVPVLALIICALFTGTTLAATRTIMPKKISIDDPSGGSTASRINLPRFTIQPIKPALCVGGFFECTLMQKIKNTHTYLSTHKNGLAYTPETRDLTPVSEVVRLTIDTQALGYLNLYEITNDQQYLTEATTRLDAIVAMGTSALAWNTFDGQVGYSMLTGYSLTGNTAYRDYAMNFVNMRCLAYPDRQMNWGYMCAMFLGKAYQITGDATYLNAARQITSRTSNKQFPDGAWPHQATLTAGENTSYSSWLMYEMITYRQYDPQNPDLDYAILQTANFLERRVNADGTLNYSDANGSYAEDPTGADSRGWLSDLVSVAYNLRATGKSEKAEKVLNYLFSLELSGDLIGSYPDKWDYIDPTNSWMTGSPSVVRTSLIFWFLTSIAKLNQAGSCTLSAPALCTISETDCSASFKELGLCTAGGAGTNTCIAGIPTGCFNAGTVQYRSVDDCDRSSNCCYDSLVRKSIITDCQTTGYRRCSGSACNSYCIEAYYENQMCTETWLSGDRCGVAGDENGTCME